MKTIILILLLACSFVLYSQDVIITITGNYSSIPIELDAIELYNYTNGTNLTLTDLPTDIVNYEINLSQGALNAINTVLNNGDAIRLKSNQPNKTEIIVSIQKPQRIYTDIYSLSGKQLLNSVIEGQAGDNILSINTNCASLIRIRTLEEVASFKSIGFNKAGSLSVQNRISQSDKIYEKSSYALKDAYFSFHLGDSLKIIAVKNNYHSNFVVKTPQHLEHYQIFLSQPCQGFETITDYDGNIYNTVQIGSQCWMKENLKTIHYADGSPMVDGTGIPTIDITTKYWFDYGDNPANSEIFGKLYSWAAVMNDANSSNSAPSGVQGVCPDGWHVPSKREWDTLVNYLGGAAIAGGKLKASGYNLWDYPNSGADNQSGFSALPGGRLVFSDYDAIYQEGFFAVCTFNIHAYVFYLENLNDNAYCVTAAGTQQNGHSVRCLKD